jgi:hypothetical protein
MQYAGVGCSLFTVTYLDWIAIVFVAIDWQQQSRTAKHMLSSLEIHVPLSWSQQGSHGRNWSRGTRISIVSARTWQLLRTCLKSWWPLTVCPRNLASLTDKTICVSNPMGDYGMSTNAASGGGADMSGSATTTAEASMITTTAYV